MGISMMTYLLNAVDMDGVGGLEDLLSTLIEPVNPDPKFVQALKLKFSTAPVVIMESGSKHLPLLAAVTGLAAGVLIFWLIKRKTKLTDQ
jgi:hypothetical protein